MTFLRRTYRSAAIAALLLTFATLAFAQLQRPQEPRRSADTQEPPQPDPRGTNASPLVVQVQPTVKTDTEATEEQRQKQQQESDRNWTRGLAIVTALLGLLQLGVIGYQVRIAARQNEIIETQNTIMAGQREAADTQSGYMRDGLAETRKTTEATSAAIILTHRPRILVRNLEVPALLQDAAGEDRSAITGHLWATNVGFTESRILRIHSEWFVGATLPMKNPVITAQPKKVSVRLAPGRSHQFELATDPVGLTIPQQVLVFGTVSHQPLSNLFLLGLIKYWDALGQMRRTAFCRRWDLKAQRFVVVDDPDYEYAD